MKGSIDLNCDLGESFGAWTMGDDANALRHVTSANIACGLHAGDPPTMRRTVALAQQHAVNIGAHPSLPDLQGFGRREMQVTPDEAYALVLYQVGALAAFARSAGTRLHHVKPHGALYNMAARDRPLADAIAAAVRDFDATLLLVGLAGSALPEAALSIGLAAAHEVFADRRYRADGSLVPRSEPGAVIHDMDESLDQAVSLAVAGSVVANDGSRIRVQADTLCLHGDRRDSGEFARRLRERLGEAGVIVRPLSMP